MRVRDRIGGKQNLEATAVVADAVLEGGGPRGKAFYDLIIQPIHIRIQLYSTYYLYKNILFFKRFTIVLKNHLYEKYLLFCLRL